MPFDSTPSDNDQVLKDLRAWRAQLAKGWCQVYMARSANGEGRAATESDAVSWCAAGAMQHSLGVEHARVMPIWTLVTAKLKELTGHDDIICYNDDPRTTQADMLALLDATIEAYIREHTRAVR